MSAEPTQRRLILGSGRSGTTWVLDCLADANNLRPIFEPLHPLESALGARYAYDVMASGDQDETLSRHFHELAAGRIRSRWIDYRGPRNLIFPKAARFFGEPGYAKRWLRRWQKYIHDRRALHASARRENTLIKCIRANLMAGWLSRTLGFRTTLLIRHPCAVVESQYRLRLGALWNPAPVLEQYRANRKLHEVTGGRYLKLLHEELTTLQALTLNWVIENQWPVERSTQDGFVVVYYEDLASTPDISWPYLCAALELREVPDLALLRKPSQQASLSSKSGYPEPVQPRWRSNLTSDQLDTIQGVLDAAECGLYSAHRPEPTFSLCTTARHFGSSVM